MKKFEDRKIDVKGDVIRSYDRMDHWKRLIFSYNKPLNKSEQYAKWKEENPPKYPGPQKYFETPIEKFDKKRSGSEGSDGEKKKPFVIRVKPDKKIYKPLKGHIF